jgi:hypothetical protein
MAIAVPPSLMFGAEFFISQGIDPFKEQGFPQEFPHFFGPGVTLFEKRGTRHLIKRLSTCPPFFEAWRKIRDMYRMRTPI